MELGDSTFDQLEQLQAALLKIPVIAFAQDAALRYVWVRPGFPGLSGEQILGKTDAAFLPADEARLAITLKQSALARGEDQRAVLCMTLGERCASTC